MDLRPARQEEGQRAKEAWKGRRGLVCWSCGEPGHVLKNCEWWKAFRKGRQLTREVDAKPELKSLQWLCSMKNKSALLHRWAAQLEDYDFEILHQLGKN